MPWLYGHETLTINRTLFLEIFAHQQVLEQALQVLNPGRSHLTTEDEKIKAFTMVNSRTRALNHFLGRRYDDLPVTARPPPADPIGAVQVFNVPELVEQVLLYLDPHSICQAAQACRPMADALSTSSKLKRKLSLIADTNCFTHSIFEGHGWSNLRCRLHIQRSRYASALPNTSGVNGEMISDFPALALPRLGVRPRAILVCQPPITEIYSYVDGCYCKVDGHRGKYQPCLTITDSNGITYGHLVDLAQRLRQDHVNRPENHAKSRFLNSEHVPSLTFAARVPLQSDHPLLCTPRSP